MRRALGIAFLTALTAGVAAAQTPAGSNRCILQIDSVGGKGYSIVAGVDTNYFAGGNVYLRCHGLPVTMRSDSIASFGGRTIEFIGRVRYRDTTLTMNADRGTYNRAAERWEARGRVVTENLKTGSKITGPMLDYYREVQGVRDTFEMIAKQRPRIEYVTLDSTGKRTEPYIIVADRVRMIGSDRMWAGGKVTIDRSDFTARGDSLQLDTGAGSAGVLIGGNPELRGTGTDSFTLRGNRIDFKLENRALTYVTAKGAAHVISHEWDLVADTIALEINDDVVEQTFAWGRSTRPSAKSTAYAMTADSLAIDSPDERLREIRGFGAAWLGGDIDSASRDRNWMRGDTVRAAFVEADSAGTTRTVLQRIESRHAAQSYHLDPNRRIPTKPSINYARGDVIVVTMRSDEKRGVERVDVKGQVDGVHIEPAAVVPVADSATTTSPPTTPTPAPTPRGTP